MSVSEIRKPAPKTLAQSATMSVGGYVPLSNISFGPNEYVLPHPVPQMPSPTGVIGNAVETYNRIADFPMVQRIFNAPRVMTKF